MKVENMPANPRQSITSQDPTHRLLGSSLGAKLLGVDVSADVYAANAFGLLGVSASVTEDELDAAIVRFRNTYKLAPELAFKQSVSVEYGNGHLRMDPLGKLGGLRDPRQRLISELFWPHISADVFANFRKMGALTNEKTLRLLEKASRKSKGKERVLSNHALALVHHNLALANEFDYLAGKTRWDVQRWSRALSSWSNVLENDDFWKFIADRIAHFDDHRIGAVDVDELRSRLPELILGFHRLYCETYITRGDLEACRNHLQLLGKAPFPSGARDTTIRLIRDASFAAELRPLVERARETLQDGTNRLPYAKFDGRWRPLVEEVIRICQRHGRVVDKEIPAEGVPECDQFCDLVMRALDTRVNYEGENHERSLLYWMVMAKRLLWLPVSRGTRQRVQLVGPDGTGFLYDDRDSDTSSVDPTKCSFLDGEEADPEASLVIDLYKITNRQVEVDTFRGTAGVRYSYNTRRVLVPRSKLAQQLHTELPAGCLGCLLVVGLVIGAALLFRPGPLDQIATWYHQTVDATPGVNETLAPVERGFESARGFLERQMHKHDIYDGGIHPAGLPLAVGFLSLGLVFGVVGKVHAARRESKLRRKVRRCQRKLDALPAGRSPSGGQQSLAKARRRQLQQAKARYEEKLERIESRKKRRRQKSRLKLESTKDNFPALKAAKSKGYKEGTEPSDEEKQMTPAERQQAISRLQNRW